MKPRNFPAKKMMRKIMVEDRASGHLSMDGAQRLETARAIRTKKDRRSMSSY